MKGKARDKVSRRACETPLSLISNVLKGCFVMKVCKHSSFSCNLNCNLGTSGGHLEARMPKKTTVS